MSDLRSKMIRMASELPQGDPTRRKLLAAVKNKTASVDDSVLKAIAKADYGGGTNYFSNLTSGMAAEARKEGLRFGLQDARVALRAWLDGEKVTRGPNPEHLLKQDAAWRYLTSSKGKKLLVGMVKLVGDVLKKSGQRVGLRDIAQAVDVFMGDPSPRRASLKSAYGIKDIEVDLENLGDPRTRAEMSDWGVNTIRDRWPVTLQRYVDARTPEIDSKRLQNQMLVEEFDRIKKGNLGFVEYLRVSRRGSEFALDRKMRMAVYAHYASKMAR